MFNPEKNGLMGGFNQPAKENLTHQEAEAAAQPKAETFEESKKFNEQYLDLKQQQQAIKDAEKELLQDENGYYDLPADIKFNEQGELVNITVNGIKEGIGKLGKILKDKAPEEEKREIINDPYIVEAYKNDPRVKEILDKYFELYKKEAELNKRMEDLQENKMEVYYKASELNKFIQELGLPGEIDSSLDLAELKQSLQDKATFAEALNQWNKLLEGLADLDIDEETKKKYELDFKAINQLFFDIQSAVEKMRLTNQDFDQDYISKKAIQAYNKWGELGR